MSILIKGMEMPTKKHGAVLIIYPSGKCAFEDGKTYQAVPVPPHGRLIDADALIDAGWQLSRDNIFTGKYEIALLSSVPTIIEAEETKDD